MVRNMPNVRILLQGVAIFGRGVYNEANVVLGGREMKRYVFKAVKRGYSVGVGGFAVDGMDLAKAQLHAHSREEIHLLVKGEAAYQVGAQKIQMRRGDLLFIPRHTLHMLYATQPGTRFYVLDGTVDIDSVQKAHVPEAVLEAIIQTGREAENQEAAERMIPWFAYLLTLLKPDAFMRVEARSDGVSALLRYISENYQRDITLADAAQAAKISQRQAQRLIKRETGLTFLEELTRQRMDVAGYLMDRAGMPLEEIAQYVGYQSYSGFWKAWQRHKKAGAERNKANKVNTAVGQK